jgi:hypothetical protein
MPKTNTLKQRCADTCRPANDNNIDALMTPQEVVILLQPIWWKQFIKCHALSDLLPIIKVSEKASYYRASTVMNLLSKMEGSRHASL